MAHATDDIDDRLVGLPYELTLSLRRFEATMRPDFRRRLGRVRATSAKSFGN
jgi:hypothetical protein